jgi:hypothetical protein
MAGSNVALPVIRSTAGASKNALFPPLILTDADSAEHPDRQALVHPPPSSPAPSLSEELVRPFNELHEDSRVREGSLLAHQVCIEDSTSPRACASHVNRYAKSHRRSQRLRQRRPTDGHDGGRHRIAHQRHALPEQEDLDLVTGLRQCVRMQKRERCLGGVVGTPRTLLLIPCSCSPPSCSTTRDQEGRVLSAKRPDAQVHLIQVRWRRPSLAASTLTQSAGFGTGRRGGGQNH